ncbi:alpha,alpha-trehalase TreF [Agromyces laixinhei]|uniref:alpha,alpha-trehalase TreF n=1 Tax=Agromyces laixinhei TaxID=2585717 RepID=UPI001116E611|nr:alpha,alpha-trehalase TreF [Agromyces laixinhei]
MELPRVAAARREAHLAAVAAADTLTPADRYQELFVAVQMERVFDDGKTFVDAVPRGRPLDILEQYRADVRREGFDLGAFVAKHFAPPAAASSEYIAAPGRSLAEHIDDLWPVLTREPTSHPPASSVLALPEPYVVPGGRFREIYYWDSYFTMLGLAESGRFDLVRSMVEDFAFLIDTYGHVPNGNRTYYLGRSQPPVFVLMVELLAEHGIGETAEFLPQLMLEHRWWTEGSDRLRPGEVRNHCVRLEDGSLLNRYWDRSDAPREEMYLADVLTAQGSRRPSHEVYRELRACAASGWDFSSRWCADPSDLSSIRTTKIVPVDLNGLLLQLEAVIARQSDAAGDHGTAQHYRTLAEHRRTAIDRWLWNDDAGAYLDFDWELAAPREPLTTATVMPLFVGAASPMQADRVAVALRDRLLRPGGIGTSEHESGEQWDKPNGWAPLQCLAIAGLRRYGHTDFANEITERWLQTVGALYRRETKLVEKYTLVPDPDQTFGGGGGEYPLQDGFGWTNGVTRHLLRGRTVDG